MSMVRASLRCSGGDAMRLQPTTLRHPYGSVRGYCANGFGASPLDTSRFGMRPNERHRGEPTGANPATQRNIERNSRAFGPPPQVHQPVRQVVEGVLGERVRTPPDRHVATD